MDIFNRLGKNFWTYFFIMFSSAFVDNILKNAMIVYVLFNQKSIWGLSSEALAPVAAGVFILPFLLFSLVAGQWCDQEDKKKIVIICKGVELVIGVLVLYLFPKEDFSFLLVCLFFLGVHSTFFGPAKYSMIKDLVKEADFVLATAWVEAGTFVSILLGTIGGSLLATHKVWDNYGVGVTMMSCSTIALLLSFFLPKFPKGATKPYEFNPVKAGFQSMRQTKKIPELYTVIGQISWFYFLATFLITMLPAMVKNDFRQDQHLVSWIYALFIIGVAAGSMYFEKLSKKGVNLSPMFSSMWSILVLLLIIGILLPFSSSNAFFIFSLMALFLLALFMGVFSTPLYSLLQQLPPKDWKSQAVASNNIANSLYMIGASLLQLVLYAVGASHSTMFFVLFVCWFWAIRDFYKVYAYEISYHIVRKLTNLHYRLVLKGEENLPTVGPAIVVCNHVSFIDWAFIGRLTFARLRFVMWYYYYQMPILKTLFDGTRNIPIAGKHEDLKYYENAFVTIEKALSNNEILVYFPEGNITKNGEVDFFRRGLTEIIKRHGKNIKIIPAYLDGMWGSFFSKDAKGGLLRNLKRFTAKRVVTLTIGKTIEGSENMDLANLRLKVLELKEKKS